DASTILLSVGAHPRELPTAQPDGERILSWTQLYDLDTLPEHLIVVGSGVTGAEFASAYRALGTEVTLVSSREKVLPGQDEDAADVLEFVFRNKGMNVLSRSRAASVTRTESGVEVVLAAAAGAPVVTGGSRPSRPATCAAGACPGAPPSPSVAAREARSAWNPARGAAVQPRKLRNVAATVFPAPEIATVGFPQANY